MKLLPPNLQAFLTVGRAGTIHLAARSLGLTQTAVTRRIAALEADLGASLFLRSRRGMQLTEAGHALLAYCRQAIELEGEALSLVLGDAADANPQVVILGPSSLLRSRVIPAVSGVLPDYPKVSVDFRVDDGPLGIESLKQGKADIVVVKRSDVLPEFDSKKLRPERYGVYGPTAWAKRPLATVVATERIIDFDQRDEVTLKVLAEYGLAATARVDRHFVNNTDALASMVVDGSGYSALAHEFAAPLVEAGRLALLGRKHYDVELALAWYPRRHMTAHFRAFIAAVK